jgi:1-acyl-sn-glycerol-3-phosphate acyltransferase
VSVLRDARFAARTAALAAYSLATYAGFETEIRIRPGAEDEPLLRHYRRRFGRHMLKLFGVDVATRGVPERGWVPRADATGRGRLFISNHRSGLDILVTLAFLEGKHLSRGDLAGWPVIGLLARRSGILFVDRTSRRSSAAAVQSMISTIEEGTGIILFPEGTTYAGDEVRPFKPGAYAVAKRTGCELVPVGLAYAGGGASFEEEEFLAHMRRVAGTKKTRVGLSVGEPLRAASGVDPGTFGELLREAVQAEVTRARALVGP